MPARPARPYRKQPSATKKASGRRQATTQSPAKKAPVKNSTTNKAIAKKPSAEKAPAKKTLVKKALAKKTLAKKALAKKAPTKNALVKKALAKNAPAKKGPPKHAPAKVVSKSALTKKASAKPVASAPKATPARDALQALAAKRAISQTLTPVQNDHSVVDSYFRDIDHPFKAEMEAVRAIILGVSDKIAERIKWNAPSFYYKEDLGAFNPRATEYAHLILLFPDGAGMDDSSGLLEGSHKDRREARFHGLDDVKAKKRALEKLVKNWIALRDA